MLVSQHTVNGMGRKNLKISNDDIHISCKCQRCVKIQILRVIVYERLLAPGGQVKGPPPLKIICHLLYLPHYLLY